MLSLKGYQVRTAITAEAGLRDVDSTRLDAIIVDFRMPDIDGLKFLRRLRAVEAHQSTPVAIVTGDYFLDDTVPVQLRALGAEVWFKPLWLEELAGLIQALLTRAR